ncbi:VPS10 domain-containing protein [Pirellulaceae bacterium SH449]
MNRSFRSFLSLSLLILATSFSLAVHGAPQEPDTSSGVNPGEAKPTAAWDDSTLTELLGTFKHRSIGPALMSGRIADIAIDPSNPNVWFVAVGSGGVWKTTNAGTTFTPIFDGQSSYSIGCVTIDPNHTDTIWVGTGENVAGRHVGIGDGVYRSKDGGKSFQKMGLEQSEHISKIVIDPRNSNVIYVAAQGPLWSPGGERGLFKSVDGGTTWRNVLSKGPYTGVTDIVMDPENPDILIAATHQRHRTVWALLDTGPESGIFRSTNGGESWQELTNGIPGGDKGKIALGISPQDKNVVYASIELTNRKGGFFRSTNGGQSFEKMSDFVSGGTGPHYYQEIYLDPHRFDVIYHANDTLVRSINGGKTFEPVEGRFKHSDNHVVVFLPTDKDFVLVGTDGGIYRSNDFCKSYTYFGNLPLTQFYKVDVDYDLPFYNVVGGTQDNNSQYGPSATRFIQGITNADWQITIGGDGHDNAIDPEDPNIIYCESQEGYIQRFDRRTGESIDIRPQPEAGEEGFRFNWDSPILISPHNHKRIYFGSKKLHRSDDRGDSWKTISPDLSKNVDRWTLPVMGRVWGIDAGFDLLAMSAYGNITSISESPLQEGLIYVGTDDGLIQVTEDGGNTWRKIERFFDVPEGAFVNDIKADRHNVDVVYACLDHHKTGDYKPYVIKSTDRGRTWKNISNNLREKHLTWRIEQDHIKPELLFLGTEYGLFCSLDAGDKWHKLSVGLPTIPVRDIAIQKRENDLVCATFGRGFYVLDDYSALRELDPEQLNKDGHLYTARRAWWYRPADKLGGVKGFQGDSYFTANNPTFGAVFTVHLKDSFKSLKEKRLEEEAKAKRENKDARVASIEELEKEQVEVLPERFLQITDATGEFVARVDLPSSKGLHRVSWDLRRTPLPGVRFRPFAFPGTYKAQAFLSDAGESKPISDAIEFLVEPLAAPSIEANSKDEIVAFQKALAAQQVVIDRSARRLAKAEEVLDEALSLVKPRLQDPAAIMLEITNLKNEVKVKQKSLFGNELQSERFIEQVPAPGARLSNIAYGAFGSTHGPTGTHRAQLAIVEKEMVQLTVEIDEIIDLKLKSLKEKLAELGFVLSRDP